MSDATRGGAPTAGPAPVAGGAQALAEHAARSAARALNAAVETRGDVTWVLAGGGTPMAAYRLLAGPLSGTVPWDRVRFLIGDERAVPYDDPDSNWGQIRAAFLDKLPIAPGALLAPRTDLPLDEAAADYERQVRELPTARSGWPRFDLVWLGVGEDGHTLSLFPGHPQLEVTDRLVIGVADSPKPPLERLTLTLPALRGTCCCVVLAAGKGKATPVARAFAGDGDLPLTRAVTEVATAGGTVAWFVDRAAAGAA